jgi:hypothetical protein
MQPIYKIALNQDGNRRRGLNPKAEIQNVSPALVAFRPSDFGLCLQRAGGQLRAVLTPLPPFVISFEHSSDDSVNTLNDVWQKQAARVISEAGRSRVIYV